MTKKEHILKAVSRADRPLLVKELMASLNLHREDRDEVKKLLRRLVREGEIIRLRGRRFGLPQKMDLVSGRFRAHRDGYGFVVPDDAGDLSGRAGDVYIGDRKYHEAMHGDRVVARIEKHKGEGRREGSIVRILERAHQQVVGRFESGRDVAYVIPSDRRLIHDICVPLNQVGRAEEGDVVMAEILSYPTKGRVPEGRIIKILGRLEDSEIDTDTVIAAYQLSADFPAEVLAEAERIGASVTAEMRAGRIDLRALPTVTIDGERARDFDDAVSIAAREDGGFKLWVHIADVSYYVAEGSALDREAYRRATSIYFPDRVVPMFPEKLSNGICSLNPKEERLTLTVEMDFSAEGLPVARRMFESVILSDARMTYTGVHRIVDVKDPEARERYAALLPQFDAMRDLAVMLRARRFEKGSLDFDLPEAEVILDDGGETVDIVREQRNDAHKIIEEFMLAANEAVAQEMTRRGKPMLYRIHEQPPTERIETLNDLLRQFGLKTRLGEKVSPKVFSEILSTVQGRPEEHLMHKTVLRAMQQARYAAENRGHFGLASEAYTHFTSPIRRYPDLVVHRLLKAVLCKGMGDAEKTRWKNQLPDIARHCSKQERLAVDAEREVIKRKQVKFMTDKIGEKYEGIVSGVTA
ncbi:MAG: ribonuclease R, partial [Nitrospiria bacterium]